MSRSASENFREINSRAVEGSPMAANRRQEPLGKQSGNVYRLCDKVLGFVYGALHCLIMYTSFA